MDEGRENLSVLERRRIEAEIIKPIYEEMKARLGIEIAQSILGAAIQKAAVAAGKSFAERETESPSIVGLARLLPLWQKADALQITVLKQSETSFHYNVTRCRYAEMYRELGLGEIGHLLSCNRDGHFCDGYDPRIKLKRTQTIMMGADHCDFRYEC